MKSVRTLLVVLAVLLTGYTALLIREYFRAKSGPSAPIHVSPVLDYTGTLDSTAGRVRVRVYKIEKWSTGSDRQDIFNSKIEIERGASSVAFVWSEDSQFYATSAAVWDLDGDGAREFVLDSQGTAVRVLFFEGESLRFRQGIDEMTSLSHDVGPRLVDQRSIFVRGIAFPSRNAKDQVPLPRLAGWSRAKGFYDVTHDLKKYYAKTMLPHLKKTMQAQTDLNRQVLYQAAIEAIDRELSSKN